MDTRQYINNMHLEGVAKFAELDPNLRRLNQQAYIWHPPLIEKLSTQEPGIYTVGGGRQVGKTTLLKQWIQYLLESGTDARSIFFLTGEMIDNHHQLLDLMQEQLTQMPNDSLKYIIIDEITYIPDWDKTVKFAADTGLLENVILIITGSDLAMIQTTRMRFPGRRGKADVVDFHLYPLSFSEFLELKEFSNNHSDFTKGEALSELYALFEQYLQHGGYLTAINDYAINKKISVATLKTYADWISGDVIKHGKQEYYLRELLSAIVKRNNTQISWNNLAQDISIDHPKTVSDYAELLVSMDALFIQSAVLEDRLIAAPKKAKRLMFTDPFIFHAIKHYLAPTSNPFEEQILPAVNDPVACSALAEACVITHYRRFYPTYYIKAQGEVDLAYVDKGRLWPVEIKWTNQIRPKELKQILKYKNARIFTKSKLYNTIDGIKTEPLPVALADLTEK